MSLVLTLKDLCLANIALNIIWHGQQLKNLQADQEDLLVLYGRLRNFCSKDLLNELRNLQHNAVAPNNEEFQELIQFLFCGKRAEHDIVNACLKLLFNEHTTSLYLWHSYDTTVSKELIDVVLDLCRNLKSMTIKLCHFTEADYFSSIPCGNSLLIVDFLYSYSNNTVLLRTLQHCPNLEVLKASGPAITDEFLYALCSNYTGKKAFYRCRGDCCGIGKNIKVLILHCTSMHDVKDLPAVGCALRHLPSLRTFSDDSPSFMIWLSNITAAIKFIKEYDMQCGQPTPALNLTSLYFPSSANDIETVTTVLSCCPYVRTFGVAISKELVKYFITHNFETLKGIFFLGDVQKEITTKRFQRFLSVLGHQLECISVTANGDTLSDNLEVRHLLNLLNGCKNLKQLRLYRMNISCDQKADGIFSETNYPKNLLKICLLWVRPVTEEVSRFFINLLSISRKVKDLCLSGELCDLVLPSAMKRNSFFCLEVISFATVNLIHTSLISLIHSKSNLKRITLYECMNAVTFSNAHRQAAKACHLSLQIDIVESVIWANVVPIYYICGE